MPSGIKFKLKLVKRNVAVFGKAAICVSVYNTYCPEFRSFDCYFRKKNFHFLR